MEKDNTVCWHKVFPINYIMIGHGKYIVTNTESDGGTIIFTFRGLSTKALAGIYVRVKCFRGDVWIHVVFWLLGANCI